MANPELIHATTCPKEDSRDSLTDAFISAGAGPSWLQQCFLASLRLVTLDNVPQCCLVQTAWLFALALSSVCLISYLSIVMCNRWL